MKALAGSALIAALLLALPATAVGPIRHYHDLVAGAGRAGFRDGAFTDALFSGPTGLASSADGSRLYVADPGNDRVRVVRLDRANVVETLTGSSRGKVDGTLAAARFAQPTALALADERHLFVADSGNGVIRLVDLAARTVSSLHVTETGTAVPPPFSDVWALAWDGSERALWASQPGRGLLRKIDVDTGRSVRVLENDARIPQPAALTLYAGRIAVADRASGAVFRIEGLSPERGVLSHLAKGTAVRALAADGDRLYALQSSGDPWVCLTTKKPVRLPATTGALLSPDEMRELLPGGQPVPAALVPDSRGGGSFFIASPELNAVLCLKDYGFEPLVESRSTNSAGMTEWEYPKKKPRGVFRVLLVGDSTSFYISDAPGWFNRMHTLAKRLELDLNLDAALSARQAAYEVLGVGEVSWNPLLHWPAIRVPPLVSAYEVDLVLLVLPPDPKVTLEAFLNRPSTAEGFPADEFDAEYVVATPLEERIRRSAARRLFDRLRARRLAIGANDTSFGLPLFSELLEDPVLRGESARHLGKLLRRLRDRIRAARPGSAAVDFAVCFYPTKMRVTSDRERDFWSQLCEAEKVPFLDLLPAVLALRKTWLPTIAEGDEDHPNVVGEDLLARLVGRAMRESLLSR